MPEYKVETFISAHLLGDQKTLNKKIEDKISKYVENGYRVFSHQTTMNNVNIVAQLVFVKED